MALPISCRGRAGSESEKSSFDCGNQNRLRRYDSLKPLIVTFSFEGFVTSASSKKAVRITIRLPLSSSNSSTRHLLACVINAVFGFRVSPCMNLNAPTTHATTRTTVHLSRSIVVLCCSSHSVSVDTSIISPCGGWWFFWQVAGLGQATCVQRGPSFSLSFLWQVSSLGRGAGLSRTARIERPLFHRGGSASTRDGPAPCPSPITLATSLPSRPSPRTSTHTAS